MYVTGKKQYCYFSMFLNFSLYLTIFIYFLILKSLLSDFNRQHSDCVTSSVVSLTTKNVDVLNYKLVGKKCSHPKF